MQINENYAVGSVFVVPAVISAAVSPVLTQVGRMILPAARMGLLHAGIMGAVHSVASNLLYFMVLRDSDDSKLLENAKYIGAHAIVAGALIAVSLLAIQAGIIASTTTLTGMVLLALANCALSYGSTYGTLALLRFIEDNKWVEFVKA